LLEYQAAVAQCEYLAEKLPKATSFRYQAARHSYDVGRLARATGRSEEAARAFRKCVAHWESLAARFPRNPAYLRDQAPATVALGHLAMARKDYGAAQEAYRQTLALNERLITQFPGARGDRFNKAWDLSHLSRAYEAAGQLQEAEQYLKRSIEEFRLLADECPNEPRYHNDLRSRRAELLRLLSTPRP
jgi:tetratricopeptide (TPR) repeat protein